LWNGKTTETLRLDERAEITGKVTYTEEDMSGTVDISVTTTVNLYLLKDVGIVAQKQNMQFKTSGDVDMNLTINSDISLTSYNVTMSATSGASILTSLKAQLAAGSDTAPPPLQTKMMKMARLLKSTTL
jgi:hypothetical protein